MFFPQVGTALSTRAGPRWECLAPAKLNLYLHVQGRRPDGFHQLETLMVPVRIYDHLRWIPGDSTQPTTGLTLRIRNDVPPAPPATGSAASTPLTAGPENLVLRAARLLAEAAGFVPQGRFELVKRIPLQAGMGGGSSDAAATLQLANAAWQTGFSPAQLRELATELGSDVPYFLQPFPAICRGRGEQVASLTGFPHMHFVVVKPPIGLATAEVFHHWRRHPTKTAAGSLDALVTLLRRGALAQAAGLMVNELEQAAARLSPWIEQARRAFDECHCTARCMTGSGSAFMGVMPSAREARRVAGYLAGKRLGAVWATSSC